MRENLASIHSYISGEFQNFFHEPPQILAFAPGRVNLIGEHTDYNQGWVMPVALDKGVYIAARPIFQAEVRLLALNLGAETQFPLEDLFQHRSEDWSDYPKGVAWAMTHAGYKLPGMEALIWGDLPIAAGLSSSAALEVSLAQAFRYLAGQEICGVELAGICQRAENEFVGVQCGIMDQLTACLGRTGQALLIDCRNLEYEYLPIPSEAVIVATHSGVNRMLSSSQYNLLRKECRAAAQILGISSLREISPEELSAKSRLLPSHLLQRARHVVTENQRVNEAAQALRAGDLAKFGQLMYDSHHSLQEDFRVSSHELDILVDAALRVEGVWGSRLTGAGFGGCTVSLVARDALSRFRKQVPDYYHEATGLDSQIYPSFPGEGAWVKAAALIQR